KRESNLDPERVPGSQSGSIWRFQSRGGRDIPAPGRSRPGAGEPQWGPQETEEESQEEAGSRRFSVTFSGMFC
ncbi:TTC23 isoform 7, partial [Pongo abelii]